MQIRDAGSSDGSYPCQLHAFADVGKTTSTFRGSKPSSRQIVPALTDAALRSRYSAILAVESCARSFADWITAKLFEAIPLRLITSLTGRHRLQVAVHDGTERQLPIYAGRLMRPAAQDACFLLSCPLHGILLSGEGLEATRMALPPHLNARAFSPLCNRRHRASLCQNCINERVAARRSRAEYALTNC